MEVPDATDSTEEVPLSPALPNSVPNGTVHESLSVNITPRLRTVLHNAYDALLPLKDRIPPTTFLRAKGIIIGSGTGAGFFLSAGVFDAILLWRTPNGSWSLPLPLSTINIGFGAFLGAFSGSYVLVLTEESCIDKLLAKDVMTIKSGMHRLCTYGPRKISTHPIENAGIKYSLRRGFMVGIGYRRFVKRMGNTKKLYSSTKGVTMEKIISGDVKVNGDLDGLELYRLMITIDACGRDSSFY